MMPGANSNSMMPMAIPPSLQNGGDGLGDGRNYWGGNGPPPGATAIPPGGQTYTIDPNTGSIFMPQDDGTVLVRVPVNGNVNAKPSASPGGKTPPANVNANVAAPPPSPTPAANPSPAPAKTPVTPAPKPTPKTPSPPTTPPPSRRRKSVICRFSREFPLKLTALLRLNFRFSLRRAKFRSAKKLPTRFSIKKTSVFPARL